MSKTKRALKYLLLIMIIYSSFIVFLFGLRFFLGTEFPIVVVEDICMVPVLYPGDLVVLRGVGDGRSIKPQDIIVFYYKPYGEGELFIHRVVKVTNISNILVFITHGDNNPPTSTETVREKDIVGVYMYKVPAIGSAILIIQSPPAKVFTAAVLIILIVVNVFYDEENPNKSQGKTPL